MTSGVSKAIIKTFGQTFGKGVILIVTIKDVAKRAEVSITTVSHVINKTRFVSTELSKRVEDAVKALGYQPNLIGRGLRKGKSYTIAILLPDPGNPFFQMVLRGIEEHAQRHNYSLMCCNTDEDPARERFLISLMQQRAIDGFIIAPTVQGKGNLSSLIKERIHLTVIDRQMESSPVDQVFSDNEGGGYQATDHLLKLGHKRIGLLAGIRGLTTIEHRLNGYRKALQDHDIEVDEKLIIEGRSKIEDGYTATKQLIGNESITAIFSTNNLMTLGALRCFKEGDISYPKDISLVGFDDSEWVAAFTPSLTVVAQQPYEMGYHAGELLFEKINGKREETDTRSIKLETTLIIRESTASPRKA